MRSVRKEIRSSLRWCRERSECRRIAQYGDPEPIITGLDDMTVRIHYGSETDTISFDPRSPHQPDIAVDYKALR